MKASDADAGKARRGNRRIAIPARTPLCLALLLAIPGVATATQTDYEAGFGLLHSDNINLSDDEAADENVLFGFLRFVAMRDSSKVRLRSRGSLQYLNYLGNEFDDEIRGDLAGQLDWSLVPERINWVFEDYLSREPIDVLTGLVPSNQQQVNVFVTGPTFKGRFNDATHGQIDLRYANSWAEDNESFNSNRFVFAGRLFRDFSPVMTGSFNIEASTADFIHDELATDYKRYDAYFGLERKLPAMDLKADLGYSTVQPDGDIDSASGPLVRFTANWQPSARHGFSARVYYLFADSAQDLVREGSFVEDEEGMEPVLSPGALFDTFDGLAQSNLVISGSVYRERSAEFAYIYTGDRFNLRIRPYVQRLSYLVDLDPLGLADQQNQKSHGESIGMDYLLREEMKLTFVTSHDYRDFTETGRTDRDWQANLGLENRMTRQWRWRFEVEHQRRDSSEFGKSYNETAVVLNLIYRH